MKYLTTAGVLLAAIGAYGVSTLPDAGAAPSTLHAISEWDATRPAEPDLSAPGSDSAPAQPSPQVHHTTSVPPQA